MQQQAGYYTESVQQLFTQRHYTDTVRPLLNLLSNFELTTNLKFQKKLKHPILSVLNNLLVRSLPAPNTAYIHEKLESAFASTERQVNTDGDVRYMFKSDELKEQLFRAFHSLPVYPQNTKELEDNSFAGLLHSKLFSAYIGAYFSKHLNNRTRYADLSIPEEEQTDAHANFGSEIIPFFLKFPYPVNQRKGLIIELDLAENELNIDYITLQAKAKFAEATGYELIVIKKSNPEEGLLRLQTFTFNPFFDTLARNHEAPLHLKTQGKTAMQTALSPFGAAAIQKVLIELICSGILDLKKERWKIAVAEQDVPAGCLAIDDFQTSYKHLCRLAQLPYDLPEIELSIFASEWFADSPLHTVKTYEINTLTDHNDFDIVIDYSALLAESNESVKETAPNTVRIRRTLLTHEPQNTLKFAQPINWKGFDKYDDSTVRESVNYLLTSLLRREKLTPDELSLLRKINSTPTCLAVSMSDSEKMTATLFSIFLNAGLSLLIPVNEIVAENWKRVLNSNNIESYAHINSAHHGTKEKHSAHTRIARNNLQLCILSPEQAYTKSVLQLIEEQTNNKGNTALLIIDGIHECAETAPEFNTYKGNLSNLYSEIKKLNKNKLRFIGFAPVSTYLYESEWANLFGILPEEIIESQKTVPEFEFKVVNVETNAEEGASDSYERRQMFSNTLLKTLTNYLAQNRSASKKILIVPNKTGTFGFTDTNGTTLTERLKVEIPDLQTVEINSVCEYGEYSGNNESISTSVSEFFKFSNSKAELILVPSIYLPDFTDVEISEVLFFNIPASPEQLQMTRLMLRENPGTPRITFFYDSKEISTYELSATTLEDGTVERMEEIRRTSPHVFYNTQTILKHFPGRQKEIQLVTELLLQIEQANTIPARSIERRIEDEYSIRTELAAHPVQNPFQLHLNIGTKTYGFIDFRNGNIVTRNSSFDRKTSGDILEFLKTEIRKRYGDNSSFFEILFSKNKRHSTSGIENMLNRMRIDEDGRMEIGLGNSVADDLSELLEIHFPQQFDIEKVTNALEQPDFIACYSQLSKTGDIGLVTQEVDIEKEVKAAFNKYRNIDLTLLALYRLKTIGAVASFRVNYGAESAEVFLHKIPSSDYKEHVQNYMSKFLTISETATQMNGFANYSGDTVLQKSVFRLINFIYDFEVNEIGKSISLTDKIIKQISTGKYPGDTKNIPYIELKMKYLHDLMSKSDSAPFDTALKFTRQTGAVISERKHLRNSVSSAITQKPDSLLFRLLAACSEVAQTNKAGSDFEPKVSELANIFSEIESVETTYPEEQQAKKITLLEHIFSAQPDIREDIEPLFFLKSHVDWLEKFNAEYFAGLFK